MMLIDQIQAIIEACPLLGAPSISAAGFEADDLIASCSAVTPKSSISLTSAPAATASAMAAASFENSFTASPLSLPLSLSLSL